MLDYRAIAALNAVIETQGFESAAKKLFITQSAVSQRIASLENFYGKPVLLRVLPYQPTELGILLLGHYKRLILLEDSLQAELSSEIYSPKISISINHDSLETWFIEVIDKLKTISPLNLEIITDDQEVTLDYLKKGLVTACVSTAPKPIAGCQAKFLGFFDYILVASPDFNKKYFKNKNTIEENLPFVPSIVFNNKDYLHMEYLKHFFNITDIKYNPHIIPSVHMFRQFILNGYAYALIPKIFVQHEIKQKSLINLFPDKILKMPLYWHCWSVEISIYKEFNQLVLSIAKKTLRQA